MVKVLSEQDAEKLTLMTDDMKERRRTEPQAVTPSTFEPSGDDAIFPGSGSFKPSERALALSIVQDMYTEKGLKIFDKTSQALARIDDRFGEGKISLSIRNRYTDKLIEASQKMLEKHTIQEEVAEQE